MLRWRVRRLGAVLALAYALSFLAVCLGGCLGTEQATHACCRSEQGFTSPSASKECCKIVPAVSGKPLVVAVLPVETPAPEHAVVYVATIARVTAPTPAAAGPPLILRI
jgi:hypothetical protein